MPEKSGRKPPKSRKCPNQPYSEKSQKSLKLGRKHVDKDSGWCFIQVIILAVLLMFSVYWGVKISLTQEKSFRIKEK